MQTVDEIEQVMRNDERMFRMIVTCALADDEISIHLFNMVRAYHADDGTGFGILANILAGTINEHIREHAEYSVQMNAVIGLLEAPAASERAH